MKATGGENKPFNSELLEAKEKEVAKLRADNDILRNIIALIPGNVFWKDKEGRFLGCNNNVAQILGYSSPAEIVGKCNNDLFDPALARLADSIDKEVHMLGEERYLEEKGLNIHKEPAIYLTKKLPLFDDTGKNTIGILGVSFDITERKKMEEDLKIAKEKAEASNRAKSQFLAVVNHELRTPLTSVVGLIDFIRQENLPIEEKKQITDSIENCAQHLLSLVNDILDFSRLETSKYNLHLNAVNLTAITDEVYGILKSLAQKKGLELRIEIDRDLPPCILTDARVMRQILINLINNAIKFTDKGEVVIQIKKISSRANKIRLEILIRDTGIGIPADKLNLIFEPFAQVEDAYTRQSSRSGTGLGLTIVKKLAELIGGKIQVNSKLGQGSVFSLVGEFESREMSPKTNQIMQKNKRGKVSTSAHKQIQFENLRVLIVEDDPIIQYIHKKMLLDIGCQVNAVSHGKEAIDLIADHDILFADISLPDISGFEVIKRIRSRYKNLPIVALTVYTGKEEKKACLKAGANQFASKPISQANLKKLLVRLVVKKQTNHS